MSARIEVDRMLVVFGIGDEQEALDLVAREGFEIATAGAGLAEKYRHPEGWERRVAYASTRRDRDRANRKRRDERNASA